MNDYLQLHPFIIPLLFQSPNSVENYLKNLDSDTRAYVMRNLDDSCTISDIQDCIKKLKG